ncbi:uncharacterized protein KQ657_002617 [Scheffersomyces spartinae]|uniref:Uncharacterized protein n=1 Tax=Scheffersomyces spartinae TaxID=45513 RepID=A0A9P8AG80_9ASCO|nr:uncharacterized protein KQ657_002617 [Scheffersomyces spartinae]KAG7192009.1 hypothetical protein KQ657_002617 [Scheffersomyces spartinae]
MGYAEDVQFQNQLKSLPNATRFFIAPEKDYSTSLEELETMSLPLVLIADQKEIPKCIALVEIIKKKRSQITVQYNGVYKWKTPLHPVSGKETEDEVKGKKMYDVPIYIGVLNDTELELDSKMWTKQTL